MTLAARLTGSFLALQRAGMTVEAVPPVGDSAQVLFDAPGSIAALGTVGVVVTEPLITYPATVLESLQAEDEITVDGAVYAVREVTSVDDGKLKQARLWSRES